MLENFDVHNCSPERLKKSGVHYTPSELSRFIAKQMLTNISLNTEREYLILDPAVGDGKLLYSLATKLISTGVKRIKIFGFDTNRDAIKKTKKLFSKFKNDHILVFKPCDFLLESESIGEQFDFVISNPPYVRTQVLGQEKAQFLAKKYNLKGRVDLYYAFFPAILKIMSKGGILGIITSNRFMTTKAGKSVRQYISSSYSIEQVWDLGDTKFFNAAVLPCVLKLKKSPNKNKTIPFTSIYTKDSDSLLHNEVILEEVLKKNGVVGYKGKAFEVRNGGLSFDSSSGSGLAWTPKNTQTLRVLNTIASNTWCKFKDVGKIRVGIKTTADNVFISDSWSTPIEHELLKITTTHHGARRWAPQTKKMNKKTLYTHLFDSDIGKRKTIDLERYPQAKAYLLDHFEQLNNRAYIHKSNRNWFEIWVPQDPRAWNRVKLVFRDIAKQPTFWIDTKNTIINGDCYWMVVNSKKGEDDLLWLAMAVANSSFSKYFYEIKFNNKLYAGRCRFMTQYVEKFPLPNPLLQESKKTILLAKEAFDCTCAEDNDKLAIIERKINATVWRLFGLEDFRLTHKNHLE